MVKNSLPIAYASMKNQKSIDFCRAFAKGCGSSTAISANRLLDGDVAGFWLPELYPILREAQRQGRNWFYGDKAYFGRERYWRITKNAYMHDCSGSATPDRFEKLGIAIEEWKVGGDILLCPQSDVYFKLQGMTQQGWINSTTSMLRQYTDRRIKIHFKQTTNNTEVVFKQQLKNIWAVVVYSSMAGAQAAIHGVPCIATEPDCVSAKFGSSDLTTIENPVKPENRENLAWVLADNQWTLDEIRSGMAWEAIK